LALSLFAEHYVCRNGVRIAASTCSTGKLRRRTPTGAFKILQKDKNHHSSIYNNAPMPKGTGSLGRALRCTPGQLPGDPASHGCVRLPKEFAERLFWSHQARYDGLELLGVFVDQLRERRSEPVRRSCSRDADKLTTVHFPGAPTSPEFANRSGRPGLSMIEATPAPTCNRLSARRTRIRKPH
jgi:hypothetical protein